MFTRRPDVKIMNSLGHCQVEDREMTLTFHDDSADLVGKLLSWDGSGAAIADIASATSYSVRSLEQAMTVLESENFVLRTDIPSALSATEAIARARKAGAFWNRYVMSHHFPTRLYSGEATRNEVFGWGIEFWHFVRGAREYMARGASRTTGRTAVLSELWNHFVEEAFHDGIFLEGLVGSGIQRSALHNRVPLPSTMALLNFLWEAAEESDLSYGAVFALMQPNAQKESTVQSEYDLLRQAYPYAAPLFDAFQKHDSIDMSLQHSSITLEPLLLERNTVSRHELLQIFRTIRSAAEHFTIFFSGIAGHYKTSWACDYRQRPNASGILYGSDSQH